MQSLQFRKPELIPLLFIIGAVTLCSGLGVWQVERLQWKNALLAQIADAQNAPAVTQLSGDPAALSYHNATLTGHYIMKELHVVGQKSGGYIWLMPFQVNGGPTILVSQGWFPSGAQVKPKSGGTETVKGILRPARGKRYFSPDNRPEQNLWFSEDVAAMGKATGTTLLPLVLDSNLPILRNDHLQYAITWFAIAVIGIVMFGIYYRKPRA